MNPLGRADRQDVGLDEGAAVLVVAAQHANQLPVTARCLSDELGAHPAFFAAAATASESA
jgi:hypothetical protein